MDVLVAVSADFGLTTEQIMHQWNIDNKCTALAVARTLPNRADSYNYPELFGSILMVLGSIATGVAANIVYELFKEKLLPSARGRHIDYKELKKPDGTTIVEFHMSEDS